MRLRHAPAILALLLLSACGKDPVVPADPTVKDILGTWYVTTVSGNPLPAIMLPSSTILLREDITFAENGLFTSEYQNTVWLAPPSSITTGTADGRYFIDAGHVTMLLGNSSFPYGDGSLALGRLTLVMSGRTYSLVKR